jgi:small Trp-rich protein
MYLVLVGTLLMVLKWLEIDPVAGWSWWWVLSPFAGAFVWWRWADATGWTKRREMDKMDDRKEQRRRKAFEALGIDYHKTGKDKKRREEFQRAREAQIQKVEGKRDAERQRHSDTIAKSRFSSGMGDLDDKPDPERKAP